MSLKQAGETILSVERNTNIMKIVSDFIYLRSVNLNSFPIRSIIWEINKI
jgi:hypothetical protein